MAINVRRRTFLKAAVTQAVVSGMLVPGRVLADAYPGKAFRAKAVPDALNEVFGTTDIASSDRIEIEAPLVAIDGGMVPVRVSSGLENTESISIVVQGNEAPFTAHFRIYEQHGFVSTRLRMANSGDLLVIVKADGVLYTSTRPVRVGRQCTA